MTARLRPAGRPSRLGGRLWPLAVLVVLAGITAIQAQELPRLTQPVSDLAHVIAPQSAAALDQRIRALEAATKDAIAVATVDSYAPYGSIEEYAVRLFERAGIGSKATDNGVLIVLAVKERRVKIEVGYGLEEFITDGFAGDTIRQEILPAFRKGDYSQGLLDGTTRIIQRIAEARGVTLTGIPVAQRTGPAIQISPGRVVFALIVLIILINRIRRGGGGSGLTGGGYRGRTWSGWHGGLGGFGGGVGGFGGGFGGGGGGGFGGFGGGRSGGGGASGGW